MIPEFLHIINNPSRYAATKLRNGEFQITSIESLQANGVRVLGLSRVEVHGTPPADHETLTPKVEPNAER